MSSRPFNRRLASRLGLVVLVFGLTAAAGTTELVLHAASPASVRVTQAVGEPIDLVVDGTVSIVVAGPVLVERLDARGVPVCGDAVVETSGIVVEGGVESHLGSAALVEAGGAGISTCSMG